MLTKLKRNRMSELNDYTLNYFNRSLGDVLFREPTPEENGKRIKENRLSNKLYRRVRRLVLKDKGHEIRTAINNLISAINFRLPGLQCRCDDCDHVFERKFFQFRRINNPSPVRSEHDAIIAIIARLLKAYPAEPVKYVSPWGQMFKEEHWNE
jgi:hypothetical protein